MRGISKRIGTEQDIINNMAISKSETLPLLIDLRDGRFAWVKASYTPLKAKESGINDATHQVRVEPLDGDPMNTADDNMARFQWEFAEDPNAPIFQAGLTVEKIQRYIDECSS